jgi:pimeloyl-ACP methyl ester carboxylesterase
MAKKITCPILAVCGKWDFLIPNEHSHLIAKVASGPAKVLELPCTGHVVELNGSDRELLQVELMSFLKAI